MTATIHKFPRDPSGNGTGGNSRGTAPGPIAPAPGATTIPADLEPLAKCHADDLRLGSILDAIEDLLERADDERRGYAHRPLGAIADIAFDGLLKIKADLDATVRSLSTRTALAEARELDRQLSDMDQAEALALWRELTAAQRSAVIWVQSEAMTPGGAA